MAGGPEVRIVGEQGVRMGRPSAIHIRLTWAEGSDEPAIEVGGGVVPVLDGELRLPPGPAADS